MGNEERLIFNAGDPPICLSKVFMMACDQISVSIYNVYTVFSPDCTVLSSSPAQIFILTVLLNTVMVWGWQAFLQKECHSCDATTEMALHGGALKSCVSPFREP